MPCSATINRKRDCKKKAGEKVTFTPPSSVFDLSQWSKQADRTTLGVKGSSFKSFAISCTLVARSLGAISANYFVSGVSRILDTDVMEVFCPSPPSADGRFPHGARLPVVGTDCQSLCL
ncbi:hypothetical protein ROHU_021145 [Labeo rohita]|uniref:Uncharacterized protein n=1 Tax=Labeo rohita TaxID=84645 RepID=A0A498MYQ9_LABRO|nr:hypothetical protein ROHU_032236 [Labeo rohita]RXN25940.1 hypothetical protein ROHU_021145 [Labeo rohita]